MNPISLKLLSNNSLDQTISTKYWELSEDGKFVYAVSELTRNFDVRAANLSRYITEISQAYSTEIKCDTCNTAYIFQNRSDFQNRQNLIRSRWVCPNCLAERKQIEENEKQVLKTRQKKIIEQHYNLSYRKEVDIKTITFENAVSILSLARLGASEDFSYISPMWTAQISFSPTEKMTYDIIRQLYRNDLIFVHPDSPPEAFEFENDTIKTIDLSRVKWALPLAKTNSEPRSIITDLENVFLNMDWPDQWFEERLEFCKKLALQECLQYLEVSLTDHQLSFSPGEKTFLVFSNLLEDFSVAQIYNFIWRAAKDAAAFYVREKVPKQHAANTVVGSIQRQGERARAEGWEVKPYRRDRRCPQSMISEVLFNTALHIGDEGFTKPLK